ncbi:MAG TPA: SIMPL domain-containing protein, partial [Candidatus Nitrosotalea sp.]|nr:SIMPL domain-containing protein [Candidatus Nitrosotalea sp.]
SLTQAAIADAKTKADQAASDIGMKVVALKSMSVYNGGFYYGPLAAASGGGVAGPIMPGQQQVSVSVNAVYVIGK